ncbi:MAG: RNA-binding S4 domain-containing protein [Clostridia bacterium]|nr:RNA-binding S4 domain-containing protein [Clostridia bacterium]
MRIDKFLKVSRLLKRRSVAASACDEARIFVGGKAVKPAYRVKVGDIITIVYGNRRLTAEVKALNEKVSKDEACTLYEVREENTDV